MTDSYQIWTCPTCGAWRKHRESGVYLTPRCSEAIHDWAVTRILVPEPPPGGPQELPPRLGSVPYVGENDTRLTLNPTEHEALMGILGYYLLKTDWIDSDDWDGPRPDTVLTRRQLAERLTPLGAMGTLGIPEAAPDAPGSAEHELERVKAEFKEWRNWHVVAIVEGMGRWITTATNHEARALGLEKDLASARRAADNFEEAYVLASKRADNAEDRVASTLERAAHAEKLLDRAEAQNMSMLKNWQPKHVLDVGPPLPKRKRWWRRIAWGQ